MSWSSHHIHYGDDCYGPAIDHLLISAVAPLIQQLLATGRIRRYFFIRYPEGGSHLRLRLDLTSEERAMETTQRLRSALDAYASESPATGRRPTLRSVEYQAETERYGGLRGVAVAEDLFHVSSHVALEVLASSPDSGPRSSACEALRWGKTLLLAVVLARSFFGRTEAAARFLRRYSESYLQILEEGAGASEPLRRRLLGGEVETPKAVDRGVRALTDTLDHGGELAAPLLDRWHQGCRSTRRQLERLAEQRRLKLAGSGSDRPRPLGAIRFEPLVASYLHLHHNRLGLNIPQEVRLAHLAASALARGGGGE